MNPSKLSIASNQDFVQEVEQLKNNGQMSREAGDKVKSFLITLLEQQVYLKQSLKQRDQQIKSYQRIFNSVAQSIAPYLGDQRLVIKEEDQSPLDLSVKSLSSNACLSKNPVVHQRPSVGVKQKDKQYSGKKPKTRTKGRSQLDPMKRKADEDKIKSKDVVVSAKKSMQALTSSRKSVKTPSSFACVSEKVVSHESHERLNSVVGVEAKKGQESKQKQKSIDKKSGFNILQEKEKPKNEKYPLDQIKPEEASLKTSTVKTVVKKPVYVNICSSDPDSCSVGCSFKDCLFHTFKSDNRNGERISVKVCPNECGTVFELKNNLIDTMRQDLRVSCSVTRNTELLKKSSPKKVKVNEDSEEQQPEYFKQNVKSYLKFLAKNYESDLRTGHLKPKQVLPLAKPAENPFVLVLKKDTEKVPSKSTEAITVQSASSLLPTASANSSPIDYPKDMIQADLSTSSSSSSDYDSSDIQLRF